MAEEIDVKTRLRIAANLRLLKYKHKFPSDAAMAKEVGISRSALNRYLKGKRTAGLDLLLKVHRRLHASLDWLVERDPPKIWENPDFDPPPDSKQDVGSA